MATHRARVADFGRYEIHAIKLVRELSGLRFAVRYLSGERKIHAIELVRELTRCGLKEAKDLVEQQGTIAFDQSASEARAIAARFEAIGSRVELVADDGREVRSRDRGALSRLADDFGDYDDGLDF